nr:PEPxxWA-CTERM sorting domain-containing protein [Polymorphobacter sp.]
MRTLFTAVMIAAASPAAAVTLTFDDLSSGGEVGSAYKAFYWDNFFALDVRTVPVSGYDAAVISPNTVALNGGANPATITAPGTFALTSGYLTAAWYDGLTVQVDGYLGGLLVFTQSFAPATTAPLFVTFDDDFIDTAVFRSFGGTQNPAFAGIGDGANFALDNLTLVSGPAVPEPASWVMMIAGFGLVGGAMRRRSVAVAA